MALLWHKENSVWKNRTGVLSYNNAGAWGKKPTWYKHDGQWYLLKNVQPVDPNVFGIVLVETGGGSGTWAWCDSNGKEIALDGTFFSSHPVYSGIQEETVDGQLMVRIPKFYIKTQTPTSGQFSGKKIRFISPTPAKGFHVYPAFMNMGQEIDCFWIGKYTGYTQDNKFCSIPDVLPTVNKTPDAFKALCDARNVDGQSGWMMASIYQYAAIQNLCLAELKTPDVKTAIGKGYVSGSTTASALKKVDDPVVAEATWRGIVSLWGGCTETVNGIDTYSSKIRVWDNKGNQTLVNTNITLPGSQAYSYPIEMSTVSGSDFDLGDIFIPDASAQLASSYANGSFASSFYGSKYANSQCKIGGNWYQGENNCGLFSLSFAHAYNYAEWSFGARLAKV